MSSGSPHAALAGLLASAALVFPAHAQTAPQPLSPRDAEAYGRALSALQDGDETRLARALHKVRDRSLVGRVTYLELMRPEHHASFQETRRWLSAYGGQPGSDKIYALARKRRLEDPALRDAADPPRPASPLNSDLQAARSAYYLAGDPAAALQLSGRCGDRWIMGLSAFRLGRYEVALRAFSGLAHDPNEGETTRVAAAYWAARGAIASGAPRDAEPYLRLAARRPASFYGILAERLLGLDPDPPGAGAVSGELGGAVAAEPPEVRRRSLARLVKTDARAHRAAALAQLGLAADASEELRAALAADGGPGRRTLWLALADALDVPLKPAGAPRASPVTGDYPSPELAPLGGFTLDRDLIYAVVRQESSFNANALSPAGAYGLMQVTPSTAALDAGIDPDGLDGSLLMDPETNLRLGQDHLARLLKASGGDLVRALAAYNAGERPVDRALAQNPDADAVTLIELLPAAETRAYVQKVLADYWMYRRLSRQPTASLDALAAGGRSAPLDAVSLPVSGSQESALAPALEGSAGGRPAASR